MVGAKLTHSMDRSRGAISNMSSWAELGGGGGISSPVPKLRLVNMDRRPRTFSNEEKARYGR